MNNLINNANKNYDRRCDHYQGQYHDTDHCSSDITNHFLNCNVITKVTDIPHGADGCLMAGVKNV
ncbi:MAG: hypothetical protein WDN75_09010 [Bacteroidota bacterium]